MEASMKVIYCPRGAHAAIFVSSSHTRGVIPLNSRSSSFLCCIHQYLVQCLEYDWIFVMPKYDMCSMDSRILV
eukprot:scaffold35468_cov237-Amphora_coffeaeformis.AAC.2